MNAFARSSHFAAATATLTLLLTACGGAEPSTTPVATSTSTATPSASPDAAAFPVTVTADNGEVILGEQPVAIVSLSPSLTEIAYEIGAGDQVIAVDKSSDFPAGTPTTDLSGFRPNIEAIGALQPDLVLLARDRDGAVATLEGVGIPVLVLSSPSDLETIYDQISTLGAATGHVDEAEALVERMRGDLDSLLDDLSRTVAAHAEPLSYFYEISGDYHSQSSGTLVGALLAQVGLQNIADGVDPAAGSFPQLTAEYIIDADPALMFVAHTDSSVPTIEEMAARPGWSGLRALADGGAGVAFPDVDLASRWGPRLVQLIGDIRTAVEGALRALSKAG